MRNQMGFVYYDSRKKSYGIDWHQSLSVLANELLLKEILVASKYFSGKLLDIGCGTRPYSLIYQPLVESSIGTETNFSTHGKDVADLVCVAETMPFCKNSFDTVICTEVIEHTKLPFEVIKEIHRIMKPDGYLLLSAPFIYPLHESPYDYWRFTQFGLQQLCFTAGLSPIYVHARGGVVAALLSLGINIVIRFVNLISNLTRIDPPLRKKKFIRWSLSLPQWIYLWITKKMSLPSWTEPLNPWITTGFILLAKKTDAKRGV